MYSSKTPMRMKDDWTPQEREFRQPPVNGSEVPPSPIKGLSSSMNTARALTMLLSHQPENAIEDYEDINMENELSFEDMEQHFGWEF